MKATGIVRRIDDLGRVVIPKEIRRTLRIQDGESLEIYTGMSGEIILKKYSPMESISDYAKRYTKAMYDTLGKGVVVTDTDKMIATSGTGMNIENRNIHMLPAYIQLLVKRKQTLLEKDSKEFKEVYPDFADNITAILITPIIKDGDIVGGILLQQLEGKDKFSDVDYKFGQLAANYLSVQM